MAVGSALASCAGGINCKASLVQDGGNLHHVCIAGIMKVGVVVLRAHSLQANKDLVCVLALSVSLALLNYSAPLPLILDEEHYHSPSRLQVGNTAAPIGGVE